MSEKNLQKKRIDEVLVERGLATSRSESKRLIIEGLVFLNGNIVQKSSTFVSEEDIISIKEPRKYVSRGGIKLEFALDEFKVSPKDKVAIDIGSSTGGFTDCLLKLNAKKIYAVDVGAGQLDLSLRNDPRVVVLEKVNARNLSIKIIQEQADLIVMDVSFISITKILPTLKTLLKDNGLIISLVKPQFEGERSFLRKGIIKDKELHKKILLNTIEQIVKMGFIVNRMTFSPIKGGKGNIEFFFLIKKVGDFVNLSDVNKIVEEIWEKIGLKK
jgi:23S rRNA (cytidine1920-2'-O)/16S rRNA (cytidine1409-2'-O)-methyltransferase